jgi:hypothetical protein
VISSSWRCHEGSRQKLADGLRPYGLSFSRFTTTQELPGGRASQVQYLLCSTRCPCLTVMPSKLVQVLHFVSENALQISSWAGGCPRSMPQAGWSNCAHVHAVVDDEDLLPGGLQSMMQQVRCTPGPCALSIDHAAALLGWCLFPAA